MFGWVLNLPLINPFVPNAPFLYSPPENIRKGTLGANGLRNVPLRLTSVDFTCDNIVKIIQALDSNKARRHDVLQ